MDYDFSAAGEILPHPVYAWMGWICALNPTEQLFEELKPYIQESYEYAKEKGIPVVNVPTYGTQIVGQYAVGLLLEICSHYGHHDQTVKEGNGRTIRTGVTGIIR